VAGKNLKKPLGVSWLAAKLAAMKKLITYLFLALVSVTFFVACSDSGDMSSPPATNPPAAPKK